MATTARRVSCQSLSASSNSSNSNSSTIDEDDPKQANRRRHMERQRLLRIKNKTTHASLVQEAADLEAAVHVAMQNKVARGPAMLLWRDVAEAIRDARDASVKTNRQLKSRVHAVQTLAEELRVWLSRHGTIIPLGLDPTGQTWRDVTLLGSNVSRHVGKEWITKRMLLNAEHVFEAHGFPGNVRDVFFDTAVAPAEDVGVRYIMRGQSTTGLPLDVLLAMYRQHMCEITTLDLTIGDIEANKMGMCETRIEETDTTVLHQAIRHHAQLDEVTHMLVGIYRKSDDRAIIVVNNILEDEAMSSHMAAMTQRPVQIWFEFQQTAPTTTHARFLGLFGSACRHKVPLPLALEATTWGVDATQWEMDDENGWEAKVTQQIHNAWRWTLESTMRRKAAIAMRFLQSMDAASIE
ncbi:Aste57867_1174 [Aphanomyces stellatus]|uniref:Aste57867_1174 protein n=1 Tax=Aphanomyces stellatus TaxID=120398 RepID=A0A485K4J5_9STRA|nr:hypothetical protein As57867_001173 [Aphanomyces stellatus]VFT78394.1 Aste57867_1174 [Aphanomyces stellatus]